MKITFPHMGNIYIALKAVFEELGVEVIPPPKCSKNTLEIGTKYSPELICIPFKITVGNYIESIERGADTLFMWGGCDVCRIGFYNTLQKEILKKLGYNIELICVEPFKNFKEINCFLEKLQRISGTKNYLKIFSSFVKGVKLLNEVDKFDELVHKIRPRELLKGAVDRLYDKFEKEIYLSRGYKETLKIIKRYKEALKDIEIDQKKDILKIGIVGEIYTVVEPFINLDLIKKLGNMGVEVHRSVVSSEFINEQLDFLPFINSEKEEVHRAAKDYLDTEIGGHARHTIGNTVRYAKENYDGVIHLLPFTCMPEIVASSILPTIEKEKDIPILKIVLDEMTGEIGYLTRIEAFVDLIERRKEYRKIV
ncbi:acyl-CoA dehydratase activase-related protein [Crassaminicella profunda]|uniref:acyl-CoA dehydratase activase-related protein n=1 Tax=Crassaminicella profunda TaxID=1286698 RepID=UPI001CA787C9|nr:acyl-CoA dehydratase activase-related protein [Crassaminicella profunda]QZY54564.1 acyl-CoA dehydratase activase-related protein [Crassaminicella profunda]